MSKSNSDEKRYNFQEVPKNKAVQYDELDKILLKLTGSKGVNRRSSVTGEKRNEAKQALLDWHNKQVEKVNKTPKSVDLTKTKVNLIDIASPNMTPEASKVVSDAIERSAEVMNKTAKPVENGELESLLHINGCQQRTAGYNEAKQGADGMDTDDMERLEKIAYDEVLNILAQEKAKWDTELIAEFEKLLEEVGRTSYKSPVYNHIENKVAKLRAKLLDKENV